MVWIGRSQVLGPDLIQGALEKVKLIRERLEAAQDKQKTYANHRQRDLEFQ